MDVFVPKPLPTLVSSIAEGAPRFGTKGAFLAALPLAWTPEYILLSTDWVDSLAKGGIRDLTLPAGLVGQPLIVRSSIVGETIWDRGTYLSIPFETTPDWAALSGAILRIRKDALARRPSVGVAVIVQRYLGDCEKGTLGNLNRLSKTREHWSRFSDIGAYESVAHRFNSQRDAPADPRQALRVSGQTPSERVFGGACRWLIDRFAPMLQRDRMLLEWAQVDGQIYLLQCDLDVENPGGVDPATLPTVSRLSQPLQAPRVLRTPLSVDIASWDKLKIIEELSTEYSPLPQQLYFLSYVDAAEALTDPNRRGDLAADFEALFGSMAIGRVSRRTGADKTTNLPCTSKCMSPEAALGWMDDQLKAHQDAEQNAADRAFILHKFIGARAGAWALYEPDSPYVQVHANWGLPDALQFYPYDAWDVHTVTEEINAYPSYKSHFLWPEPDGEWSFKEIRNSLGRHQCLKMSEVLEIARKTTAIGAKLDKRVAVMWFAGVETETGGRVCLPWYRTFEYAPPDLDTALGQDHVIVPVREPDDLVQAKAAAAVLAAPRRLALDILPSAHLVREQSFLAEIIALAQEIGAAIIYSGSPYAHPYYQLKGKVPVFLRLHRKSFRTRSRIKFHKLVRDGIPERVSSKHERVVYANLQSDEILQLLTGKLIEESQELIAAEGQEATAEELADVYEVLRGMMHQAGVDEARVVEIANQKRARIGGFDRGVFLLETSLPKPGEAITEARDVAFDSLIKEEYGQGRVLIPFALLGRLSLSGDRLFKIPGSDQAVRLSSGRDGFELSLEQQERQLEITFPEPEDDMADD